MLSCSDGVVIGGIGGHSIVDVHVQDAANGFEVEAGSDKNVLTDNSVLDIASTGFLIRGSRCKLEGNSASNVGNEAFYLLGSKNKLVGNTVSDGGSSGDGFYMQAAKNSLRENVATDVFTGFYVAQDGVKTKLVENRFLYQQERGLLHRCRVETGQEHGHDERVHGHPGRHCRQGQGHRQYGYRQRRLRSLRFRAGLSEPRLEEERLYDGDPGRLHSIAGSKW